MAAWPPTKARSSRSQRLSSVLKEVHVRNGASLDITFEKVMRAKLHKWRVEQRVARAAQMVRARYGRLCVGMRNTRIGAYGPHTALTAP